ncbi:MAG: hypothetical protein M1155_01280 [Patescibacteria group bacterium]|nr:hypothetical protein [Patescibacteria group bacterium]
MIKQFFIFISLAITGVGFYLASFYDVPDAQTTINFFTSWFLIIVGLSGLLTSLFWGKSKK